LAGALGHRPETAAASSQERHADNPNAKGMFGYMEFEYIYLQKGKQFNNLVNSLSQIKFQIHLYNVYKVKAQEPPKVFIQVRALCCSRGSHHPSLHAQLISVMERETQKWQFCTFEMSCRPRTAGNREISGPFSSFCCSSAFIFQIDLKQQRKLNRERSTKRVRQIK
jgi:hypothetical protein